MSTDSNEQLTATGPAKDPEGSATSTNQSEKFPNFKALLGGAGIGVASVVPGVSGGTIAVVIRLYDRILEAVGNLRGKPYGLRGNLVFLAQLAVGLAAGVLGFSFLMGILMTHIPDQTRMWFVGLIAGSVPFLVTQFERPKLRPWHALGFLAGFGVMLAFLFASQGMSSALGDSPSSAFELVGAVEVVVLFSAGALAAAAMVVPGISGSFLLLALGLYEAVLGAVRSFDIPFLLVFGLGVLAGIVLISKLIAFLLRRFRNATFACILGLVVGSVPAIVPDFSSGEGIPGSILALALGVAMSLLLGSRKKSPKKN